MTPPTEETLRHGALGVLGRIRSASNATFLCEAQLADGSARHCVYKPIRGERPLWDFPDGTLAGRELASYLISEGLGWNLVPDTVIRDGPHGPGMVQRWVHQAGDGLAGSPDPPADPEPDLVDVCPVAEVPVGYLPVLRAQDYDGNCARCCGVGPACRSTTTPWPRSPSSPGCSTVNSARNWPRI